MNQTLFTISEQAEKSSMRHRLWCYKSFAVVLAKRFGNDGERARFVQHVCEGVLDV